MKTVIIGGVAGGASAAARLRTLHEAVSIDPQRKTVAVRDIRRDCVYEESYDSLVLSPGAEPIRPKIDGIDSPAVFSLRNIPDTLKIKAYIESEKPVSAVVVGGGYIGVEMAENLKRRGWTYPLSNCPTT